MVQKILKRKAAASHSCEKRNVRVFWAFDSFLLALLRMSIEKERFFCAKSVFFALYTQLQCRQTNDGSFCYVCPLSYL